jgi:hypothetical protein
VSPSTWRCFLAREMGDSALTNTYRIRISHAMTSKKKSTRAKPGSRRPKTRPLAEAPILRKLKGVGGFEDVFTPTPIPTPLPPAAHCPSCGGECLIYR